MDMFKGSALGPLLSLVLRDKLMDHQLLQTVFNGSRLKVVESREYVGIGLEKWKYKLDREIQG